VRNEIKSPVFKGGVFYFNRKIISLFLKLVVTHFEISVLSQFEFFSRGLSLIKFPQETAQKTPSIQNAIVKIDFLIFYSCVNK